MKQILLFGAGKSSTCLIDYLVQNAGTENWHITIADVNTAIIEAKTNKAVCTTAVAVDINNATAREAYIASSDIVISLMPPSLHFLIAQSCLSAGKDLLTASYVDEQLTGIADEIEKKGLLFLCEMGLDPGIDHMSAMQMIDGIKAKGGTITSFKSHCGGLVAPESDDNPWHYKISWNPRNVVLAGSAGAVYKVWDEEEEVAYEDIFSECAEIEVEGTGSFAWYPNRDSLSYIPVYKLEEAATFIRTTLRHPAFCRAWAILVDIEMTSNDDGEVISNCKTIAEWFNHKVTRAAGMDWEAFKMTSVKEEDQKEITEMFSWLGLFSDKQVPENHSSSAVILQQILEEKLVLLPHDKDMVVMVHEIDYAIGEDETTLVSSLVVKGLDNLRTAMAKTVGLPLGIAAKLILNGTIQLTGLHIPIIKEIYNPVLAELQQNGISFTETEEAL
ncbi:MAG: saccharopine dehydrogenase C-terminal domain-containing protein [Bacteroidota bacterium]